MFLHTAFAQSWRQPYCYRTNSRAPEHIRVGIKKLYRLQNIVSLQPVDTSFQHCMLPTRASFDCRAMTVQQTRLCDESTEIELGTCNLRATSVRICSDQSLNNLYKNHTLNVYNINTNAVSRSHQRCLNNRTENLRRRYRTAPVAKVNET